MLDEPAHTRPRDPAPSKDLDGIARGLLGVLGEVHLEEGDLAGELGGDVFIGHVVHLVGDAFEPVLAGFDAGDHGGEFVADDGLGDEGFAEDLGRGKCQLEVGGE